MPRKVGERRLGKEVEGMEMLGRENGEDVKIANPFYTSNTEERKTLIYSSPAKPLPQKEEPTVGITSYDPEAEKKSYEIKDKR